MLCLHMDVDHALTSSGSNRLEEALVDYALPIILFFYSLNISPIDHVPL